MASLLNWKILQTEKPTKTFLIKEGNWGEIWNAVREKDRPARWVILTSREAVRSWLHLIVARLVPPVTGLHWALPCRSSRLTYKINAITLSRVVPLLLGLRQIVSEINSNFSPELNYNFQTFKLLYGSPILTMDTVYSLQHRNAMRRVQWRL